jgi:hypothetical protein
MWENDGEAFIAILLERLFSLGSVS